MSGTAMNPLVILGCGYAGEALAAAAPGAGFNPVPTSRRPGHRGHSAADSRRLTSEGTSPWVKFDLGDSRTWRNLPPSHHYAWLFPAAPLEPVARFAEQLDLKCRTVAVVGTTSSYLPSQDGALVDETCDLDLEAERVKGEEYLRSIGAVVLRAAGIYGPALGPHPARNPLSWLQRGMIASPDALVNLIHVHDLAAALLEALKRELRGEQMIVSDGTPRRWGDIAEWAVQQNLLTEARFAAGVRGSTSGAARKSSKRLSNERVLSLLGPVLKHTDLYRELPNLPIQQDS